MPNPARDRLTARPGSRPSLDGFAASRRLHRLARSAFMPWPPQLGDPLPRAQAAWYEPLKLDRWILAEHGHGPEWRRVYHVGVADRERVWHAIRAAVQDAVIASVRNRGRNGVVCAVEVELALAGRTARVNISWHYANERSAPRLMTAYVTL